MDFFEVIAKRHSVRKYADRPVERELLDRMVSAAETAPSSKNTRSSAFMIIEDRDTIAAATSVMGRSLKHLGVMACSTRRRTPENSTMATR